MTNQKEESKGQKKIWKWPWLVYYKFKWIGIKNNFLLDEGGHLRKSLCAPTSGAVQ